MFGWLAGGAPAQPHGALLPSTLGAGVGALPAGDRDRGLGAVLTAVLQGALWAVGRHTHFNMDVPVGPPRESWVPSSAVSGVSGKAGALPSSPGPQCQGTVASASWVQACCWDPTAMSPGPCPGVPLTVDHQPGSPGRGARLVCGLALVLPTVRERDRGQEQGPFLQHCHTWPARQGLCRWALPPRDLRLGRPWQGVPRSAWTYPPPPPPVLMSLALWHVVPGERGRSEPQVPTALPAQGCPPASRLPGPTGVGHGPVLCFLPREAVPGHLMEDVTHTL